MNKLLKTIKENDEEFLELDYYKLFRPAHIDHIKKSRIKELEVLVKVIRKKGKLWGSDNIESDWQIIGYNEAIDDIIQIIQDTIKELKL